MTEAARVSARPAGAGSEIWHNNRRRRVKHPDTAFRRRRQCPDAASHGYIANSLSLMSAIGPRITGSNSFNSDRATRRLGDGKAVLDRNALYIDRGEKLIGVGGHFRSPQRRFMLQ